jgi:biotin carboxylase
MREAAKHVLLLMPREGYILARFTRALQHLGLDVTLAFDQPAEKSWLLVSLVNGEYGSLTRLPYSSDASQLPELPFPVDAVIPTSEFSVQLCERLGAAAGVFHNPLDAVPAYRDKQQMRRLFAEQGVHQPQVLARFDSLEAVDAFDWASVSFPVIAKPLDLTSSLYVKLCHSQAEARAVYRRIFKHVQSFGGVTFSGAGLLETYVPGPEFSAECVVSEGTLTHLFVTTKFVSPLPACDEIGHLSGAPVSPAHWQAAHDAARKVIRAWNIGRAVLHIEYKFVNGSAIVMEAGCRIGGDFIAELVELQHGVCLEEELVALRLGARANAVEGALPQPAAARHFHGIRFLFASSRVAASPDIDVLREVRYTRAPAPSQQFGIHDRLGYQVVRSASLVSLTAYLGQDSQAESLRHAEATA